MSTEKTPAKLESLLRLLRDTHGFDVSVYKRPTLTRRIQRRMQVIGIADYDGYADHVNGHPEEVAGLLDTILINVTGFFRDPEAWEVLRKDVVPEMLAARPPDESVRVWSAGCATGQEPYSLVMLLAEVIGPEGARRRLKVYCTDVDDAALNKGRTAAYTAKEVEGIPAPLLAKYFERAGDSFIFDKELRRVVIFGRHDLLEDAPISRIDLLCCRNTLMYFNVEAQAKILTRLHYALNENGFLFLGRAEMLLTHTDMFTPLSLKHRIFTKVPSYHPSEPAFAAAGNPGNNPNHRRDHPDASRILDAAFQVGGHAQIVINAEGEVVLANEQAHSLLDLGERLIGRPLGAAGLASRLPELEAWIDEAVSERRPIVRKNLSWTLPSGPGRIDIHVVPLLHGGGQPAGVSIVAIDVTPYRQLEEELAKTRLDLGVVNEELQTTNEELQSTNEELETTNEELQSTNEELETTNEELQSSNEELETMNEELHSTNEELQASNEELQSRTLQLNDTNAFLSSILGSMPQGVTVLDADLVVRVWSERAQDMWGLRVDEAVGKHFLNLDINLPVDRLRQPIRTVLSGADATRELTLEALNRRGKPITCRILIAPLLDREDSVGGIIVLMEEAAAGEKSS